MIFSAKYELSFIPAIFQHGHWSSWFWLSACGGGVVLLIHYGIHHDIDPIPSFNKWKPQDDFYLLLSLVGETLSYIRFCFFLSPDPLFW